MAEAADLPLASVIRALRRELVAAVQEGQEEEVRFALGPIDLELEVEVANTGGGEAGIKFWVISLGGKAERKSGRTQTLRLTLTPALAGGIAGDVPLIVGSEQLQQPD